MTDRDITGLLFVGLFATTGFIGMVSSMPLFLASIAALIFIIFWSVREDKTLETAEDAYYNRGEPTMSDEEYDALKRQSDSDNVGAPVIGGTTHATRMRSLRNAIDEDELRDFFNGITAKIGTSEFIIEPKIDGLALNVTYSGGALVSAVTRGDGEAGKDVTDKVRHIMPEKLKGNLEIRGEIYLDKSSLAAINSGREATGKDGYKTCQSAATATLMNESIAICKARKIKFVAYDMGTGKSDTATNQASLSDQLKRFGFKTLEHSKVRTFDGMLRASKRIYSECKLPSDGAVIKLNDFDGQDAIGVTKQAPNWAIAWKGMRA